MCSLCPFLVLLYSAWLNAHAKPLGTAGKYREQKPAASEMDEVLGNSDYGVSELPAEHLRHAGHYLPELTDELLSAQSSLCSEVSRKEDVLARLQGELGQVRDALEVTEQRVCYSIRTVCLKEDELMGLSEECDTLESDIASLGLKIQQAGERLKDVCKQKDNLTFMKNRYKKKMEDYQGKINEMDDTPIQREIKEMKKRIGCLREKSN